MAEATERERLIDGALRVLAKSAATVALGCLVGLALGAFSPEASEFVQLCIVYPVMNLFKNALSMIAMPVTFFALVTSASRFYRTFREGQLGRSLLVRYLVSAAVAVLVGGLVFAASTPVEVAGSLSDYVTDSQAADDDVVELVANLIPPNIMDPLVKGDSLQLLMLAVIMGLAVGGVAREFPFVDQLFNAIDRVFVKMLEILFAASPYALFFAVIGLYLAGGFDFVVSLLLMFAAFLVGLALFTGIVLVALKVRGTSPIAFLKAYLPFAFKVLRTGSTIECIPGNIEYCHETFGISRERLEEMVPFCAHNNMDGNCLFLGITTLSIAYVCGFEIDVSLVVILMIVSIVLSAGAPNQPGSGIICMAVILPMMGVSTEFIVPVIFLDLLAESLIAFTNSIGDAATVVALNSR